jgi:hypothetical protein
MHNWPSHWRPLAWSQSQGPWGCWKGLVEFFQIFCFRVLTLPGPNHAWHTAKPNKNHRGTQVPSRKNVEGMPGMRWLSTYLKSSEICLSQPTQLGNDGNMTFRSCHWPAWQQTWRTKKQQFFHISVSYCFIGIHCFSISLRCFHVRSHPGLRFFLFWDIPSGELT